MHQDGTSMPGAAAPGKYPGKRERNYVTVTLCIVMSNGNRVADDYQLSLFQLHIQCFCLFCYCSIFRCKFYIYSGIISKVIVLYIRLYRSVLFSIQTDKNCDRLCLVGYIESAEQSRTAEQNKISKLTVKLQIISTEHDCRM